MMNRSKTSVRLEARVCTLDDANEERECSRDPHTESERSVEPREINENKRSAMMMHKLVASVLYVF